MSQQFVWHFDNFFYFKIPVMMQPLKRSVAKSAWKWDIGLTSAKASVNTFIGIQEPRRWNENFKASIPLKLSKIILFLFQKWIPDISIKINVIKIFNKIKFFLNKNIWWRMSKKIGFRIFFFNWKGITLNREMCF